MHSQRLLQRASKPNFSQIFSLEEPLAAPIIAKAESYTTILILNEMACCKPCPILYHQS